MLIELQKGQELSSVAENLHEVVNRATDQCLKRERGKYTMDQIRQAILDANFQQVEWKNSAMDYPVKISKENSQNKISGWRIKLAIDGENFEIHTNRDGSQIAMPQYRSWAEANECIQSIGNQFGLPIHDIDELTYTSHTVSSIWHRRKNFDHWKKFFCSKFPKAISLHQDNIVFSGGPKNLIDAIRRHLPKVLMPDCYGCHLMSVKIDWSHDGTMDKFEAHYISHLEIPELQIDPNGSRLCTEDVLVNYIQTGRVIRKENHFEIQITESKGIIPKGHRNPVFWG